jgi:hypothetical protein
VLIQRLRDAQVYFQDNIVYCICMDIQNENENEIDMTATCASYVATPIRSHFDIFLFFINSTTFFPHITTTTTTLDGASWCIDQPREDPVIALKIHRRV